MKRMNKMLVIITAATLTFSLLPVEQRKHIR